MSTLTRNWIALSRRFHPPTNSGVSISPSIMEVPPSYRVIVLLFSTLEVNSSSWPPVSNPLFLTRRCAHTNIPITRADAFETYISQIGAICDSSPGFCFIAPDKYDSLQSLFFGIGDSSFELTANAQIWPRALNSQIGGTNDHIYLAIQSLPTSSGEGPDCVLGRTFLERFYTIYDTTNNRVGVANTQFTTATTN